MYSALLIILVILFLAVAFSLQNSEPIKVNFFSTFEVSLVVLLLTTLASGVLLSLIASLPSSIRKSRVIAQQQKTIAKLQQSAAEQKPLPVNHEAS